MEAHHTPTRWTYSEFARLPSDTNTRYEIVAGELVATPAPGRVHQRIATDLVTLLNTFVRTNRLGEVFAGPFDVLFAEGDYLEPDIVFVRKERSGIVTDRGVEGPPDLVVEILSPATAERDRGIKLERYRHYRVAEYWIVDPGARAIEVWRLGEAADEAEVFDAEATLRWRPIKGGATLEVRVAEVVGDG